MKNLSSLEIEFAILLERDDITTHKGLIRPDPQTGLHIDIYKNIENYIKIKRLTKASLKLLKVTV
jgi:hypothetical protein